jgi:hypothetical protein
MPTPSATDPLSALLRRADPASALASADPAAFAASVRARIRTADTAPTRASATFPSAFARQLFPLAAALALLASLAAGGSLAYAAHQRDRVAFFADAYARSIDPVLMHASLPAPGHAHR